MRAVVPSCAVVVLVTVLGRAAVAFAQLPVCPQPSPDQEYYTACVPGGRLLVARVLFDLAVDHVFKGDTEPIERRAGDVFRSLVSDETLEKNGDLRAYLDDLQPIKLTKIDTVTGMLELPIPEQSRRFTGALNAGSVSYRIAWQLPERISGGYWRTPGVLQVAFWEGRRPTIHVGDASEVDFEMQVECVAISGDGIRVVPTGAGPHVLVRFDECG